MRLSSKHKQEIQKAAKKARLDFVRLFGSAVRSMRKARDIDVVFGNRKLNLAEFSAFVEFAAKAKRLK